MSGQSKIPERLINFRVYDEENTPLGLATVDLPQLQSMSDTVSGAGIACAIDSPVLGPYLRKPTTFHWRTIEPEAAKLSRQRSHQVDLRGSQQVYDTSSGDYATVAVRATLKITPKSYNLGTFEPGSTTDSEQEFEVTYLKLYVDGNEVVEVDKYNFIAKVGDADVLESVRKDLGIG